MNDDREDRDDHDDHSVRHCNKIIYNLYVFSVLCCWRSWGAVQLIENIYIYKYNSRLIYGM